jgi:predicted DCC family thiol-disulfide oxidoreductase YuxK
MVLLLMLRMTKINITDLGHPVMLFDGVCNLCNASVQWVLQQDKKGVFRFAALQSETGRQLMESHGMSTEKIETVVLVSGQKVFTHSDAALEMVRLLGGAWSILYIFRWIPKGLRDAVYRFVARNRYRWFGERATCMMPKPEWAGRFL